MTVRNKPAMILFSRRFGLTKPVFFRYTTYVYFADTAKAHSYKQKGA